MALKIVLVISHKEADIIITTTATKTMVHVHPLVKGRDHVRRLLLAQATITTKEAISETTRERNHIVGPTQTTRRTTTTGATYTTTIGVAIIQAVITMTAVIIPSLGLKIEVLMDTTFLQATALSSLFPRATSIIQTTLNTSVA
jgi:hypothetical protein